MKETTAERHERLVAFGAKRYREMFLKLFSKEVQGGRVPGTTELSDEELHALFREMPAELFQQTAVQNPALALKMLNDFARLEGEDVAIR